MCYQDRDASIFAKHNAFTVLHTIFTEKLAPLALPEVEGESSEERKKRSDHAEKEHARRVQAQVRSPFLCSSLNVLACC